MQGVRLPEAQRSPFGDRCPNAYGDLRLRLTDRQASADGGTYRARASGRATEICEWAARVAPAGYPFGPVLGRRAEPEVRRLLAGVVVAGVADGQVARSPTESGNDAARELVPVQMAWHCAASRPAGP